MKYFCGTSSPLKISVTPFPSFFISKLAESKSVESVFKPFAANVCSALASKLTLKVRPIIDYFKKKEANNGKNFETQGRLDFVLRKALFHNLDIHKNRSLCVFSLCLLLCHSLILNFDYLKIMFKMWNTQNL